VSVAYVFLVIEFILKLFGLWKQFENWFDARRIAENEERRQRRELALEDLKNATTPEEIEDAQKRLVENSN
jgi:hypothetical protein